MTHLVRSYKSFSDCLCLANGKLHVVEAAMLAAGAMHGAPADWQRVAEAIKIMRDFE